MNNCLIVLVGISGSGKSSWAKEWLLWGDNRIVVSTDELRGELLGNVEDQTHDQLIFNRAYELIDKGLKAGKDVVFDATNLTIRDRKKLCKKFFNYDKFALVFPMSVEESLRRQELRDRQVPEYIVQRQLNKFTKPTKAEGFKEVVMQNNDF